MLGVDACQGGRGGGGDRDRLLRLCDKRCGNAKSLLVKCSVLIYTAS